MKQKEFNNLNLEKGKHYTVTYRSRQMGDRKIYTAKGYYIGQSNPPTDVNIFETQEWDNSFYSIYTRQIISVK